MNELIGEVDLSANDLKEAAEKEQYAQALRFEAISKRMGGKSAAEAQRARDEAERIHRVRHYERTL